MRPVQRAHSQCQALGLNDMVQGSSRLQYHDLTGLPSEQQLRCIGLSRVHMYESKCNLTLRDNCLNILFLNIGLLLECWQFIPLIYDPRVKWKVSNIQGFQPTLPVHLRKVMCPSSFSCLDCEKYYDLSYLIITCLFQDCWRESPTKMMVTSSRNIWSPCLICPSVPQLHLKSWTICVNSIPTFWYVIISRVVSNLARVPRCQQWHPQHYLCCAASGPQWHPRHLRRHVCKIR